ncbi:dienelactone hydrolase endo-1,3,1,4-beta-D-glucanase [Gautieria morchelliformis]|nr:dienelactone hydrolase endo-1,3,1,4-beta-D-glucanase [Gautieria morchelliformis]
MSALCEHCLQGYALEGTPSGKLEGTDYYKAAPGGSTTAVVLLTDIFGLKLINPKLMADQYSERLGCDVWVPDYFNVGKPPFDESKMGPLLPDVPNTATSFFQKLKFIFAIMGCMPSLISNRPSVVDHRTTAFVKRIKEQKKYEKIGVIGFCFGGAIVVRLASTDLFNSAIVAHPAGTSPAEIEAMKIPTSWICAEEDRSFGPEYRAQTEDIWKRKHENSKLDYEFKDYKGTVHGFAARPNLGNPVIKKAWEDSFEQTIAWYKKTL